MQCEQDTSIGWLGHDFPSPLQSKLVLGRNYYEAVPLAGLEIKWKVPPFYAAASAEDVDNEDTIWLVGGTDNRLRLYTEKSTDPEITLSGWGSDFAAVSNRCGTKARQLTLVTNPGDWTQPDAIRAFEFTNRQPTPASMPAEFPGPVTALWSRDDGKFALAVARNLKTGRYEAYRITISCGK
jgi:hypothetical protein